MFSSMWQQKERSKFGLEIYHRTSFAVALLKKKIVDLLTEIMIIPVQFWLSNTLCWLLLTIHLDMSMIFIFILDKISTHTKDGIFCAKHVCTVRNVSVQLLTKIDTPKNTRSHNTTTYVQSMGKELHPSPYLRYKSNTFSTYRLFSKRVFRVETKYE